jgi:hypothetical protein
MMAQQAFGRGIIISVDLICPRLNVESHELAIVPRPKVGTDVTLIDGLSPPGKLFFAVAWFQYGHGLPPTQTRETSGYHVLLCDFLGHSITFKIATFL